jgi:hypothetical protein
MLLARPSPHGARMTLPCQHCQQPVRWIRTSSGGLAAIDPDPNPEGDMILVDGVGYQAGSLYESPPGPRHRQHNLACVGLAKERQR